MNETNMEDLNSYFEDQTYTQEEEQMLEGWYEGKPYPGIIIKREETLTTNPDKITGQQQPMLVFYINFQVENSREKEVRHFIVFYPKDHKYHSMTRDNTEKFKKATGVNAKNAFADKDIFIGKELEAVFKKRGQYASIDYFMEKGVIDEMKQTNQTAPDGKSTEKFDDDIPF